MFKSKSKKHAKEASVPWPAAEGQQPSDQHTPDDAPAEEVATAPAPVAAEAPVAATPAPAAAEFGEPKPAAAPTYRAEPQPAAGDRERPLSQYLKASELLANPARTSEEQRQQAAAADLMAALAPSRDLLLEEVPEASSPEEATRILQERQEARGEALPDRGAAKMVRTDIYSNDTSVYYRLRKQVYLLPRRLGPRPQWAPPSGLARPAVTRGSESGSSTSKGQLPSPQI